MSCFVFVDTYCIYHKKGVIEGKFSFILGLYKDFQKYFVIFYATIYNVNIKSFANIELDEKDIQISSIIHLSN